MADSASPSLAQPISTWSDGSRNFQVYLRPRVMGRLGTEAWVAFKRVPRRGLEIGGVLLGRTECRENSTTFWIEGFTAVESEHRSGPSYIPSEADLARLQNEISKNGSASIGIFRSQTRSEQLALQEPDTSLLERYFNAKDSLFLMVGPVPGKAALFLRTNGILHSVQEFALASLSSVLKGSQNSPSPEIPVPSSAPEIRPARLVRQVEPAIVPIPEAIEQPVDRQAVLTPSTPHEEGAESPHNGASAPSEALASIGSRGRSRWTRRKLGTWIVTGVLAVLLIAVASIPRSSPSPQTRNALEYIQLGVAREGSLLRVHWDRNAPALRNATRAVLHVTDGDAQVDKILTASDLSSGSTAYQPQSSALAFRLDVYAAEPRATGLVQVMNLVPGAGTPEPQRAEPHVQAANAPSHETRRPAPEASPDIAPLATRAVANTEVFAKIPLPVSKSEEESNRPIPVTEPARPDRIEPKAPAATDSSAPKIPEKPPQPPAPAQAARSATLTTDIPASTSSVTGAGPSVSILAEPVSGSKIGHVVGKVPLLRRLASRDNVAAAVPAHQAQPSLKLPNQHVIVPVSIDVKVDVSQSGKVTAAEVVDYGEPPNFSLANAALAASRQWTFQPARLDDVPVSSQMVLHFRFEP